MGCFTEVQHPRTGRWIQFKTGDDACERVQVGHKFHWVPTRYNIGHWYDDVYNDEIWYHEPDPAFVVVKNSTIVAVVDFVKPDSENEDTKYEAAWEQTGAIAAQYGIGPPPRELWPESWWAEKAEQDAKWRAEYDAETERYRAQGFDVDGLGFQMARPIMRNLDYAGVAGRVLVVSNPLDHGKEPVHNRDDGVEKNPQTFIDKIKKLAAFVGGLR